MLFKLTFGIPKYQNTLLDWKNSKKYYRCFEKTFQISLLVIKKVCKETVASNLRICC